MGLNGKKSGKAGKAGKHGGKPGKGGKGGKQPKTKDMQAQIIQMAFKEYQVKLKACRRSRCAALLSCTV